MIVEPVDSRYDREEPYGREPNGDPNHIRIRSIA